MRASTANRVYSLLETIRTLRPTVRAVLMNGAQVPLRQMVRDLRNEPRHVPCFDEFQHVDSRVRAAGQRVTAHLTPSVPVVAITHVR